MEVRRESQSYTVADYEQWDGLWELWDGVAVAMSPSPGVVHQRAVRRLTFLLDAALRDAGCGCEVFFELDWRIDEGSVVRPDVSVCCETFEHEWISRPPRLIAEVLSPSTALKDRTAKRSLYEALGVKAYLLCDPETKRVEALRLDEAGRYQPVTGHEFDFGDGCLVSVDLDAIWG